MFCVVPYKSAFCLTFCSTFRVFINNYVVNDDNDSTDESIVNTTIMINVHAFYGWQECSCMFVFVCLCACLCVCVCVCVCARARARDIYREMEDYCVDPTRFQSIYMLAIISETFSAEGAVGWREHMNELNKQKYM